MRNDRMVVVASRGGGLFRRLLLVHGLGAERFGAELMKGSRLIAAALLVGLACASAHAQSGPAVVVDGDTLKVGGTTMRLYGIDAPELRQICRKRGRDWACGVAAKQFMEALTKGRNVLCVKKRIDFYRRTIATCTADGNDLGSSMISAGMAVAYMQYGGATYKPAEARARVAGRGLWGSEFQYPDEWRRMNK